MDTYKGLRLRVAVIPPLAKARGFWFSSPSVAFALEINAFRIGLSQAALRGSSA
jgi:hypothetical protein